MKDKATFKPEDEFYRKTLMPALFSFLDSGITQTSSYSFSLMYAVMIGLRNGSLKSEEYEDFICNFWKSGDNLKWDSSLLSEAEIEYNWSGNLDNMISAILSLSPESETCLKKIRERLEQVNFNSSEVGRILNYVLTKSHFNELPLFLRILIMIRHPDSTLKLLLEEFIQEQLNSVFEFQKSNLMLSNLIRLGNWNFPIAIHSLPGINIISLICSLANCNGVGLEVIRKENMLDIDTEDDPITLNLISACAKEGNWVLISTEQFPINWKGICQLLRETDEIHKDFRIFFDLQGLSHSEIPDHFLHVECARFYLSEKNREAVLENIEIWTGSKENLIANRN